MESTSITLKATANTRTNPAPNGKIDFKSPIHNFEFKSDETQIHFRVGAAVDLSKGIYYLDWTITENTTTNYYNKAVKTKVEVIAKKENHYAFSVEAPTQAITKGYSSPAIRVSTTNAPFTAVSVGLKLANANTAITFTPTSLTFNSVTTEQYFQINIDAAYKAAVPAVALQVVFTTTGVDAAVFAAPASMTFTINETAGATTAGVITSLGAGTATKTTNSFSPKVTQVGTLWWAFMVAKSNYDNTLFANAKCPEQSAIEANSAGRTVSEENKTDAQKKNDTKMKDAYAA